LVAAPELWGDIEELVCALLIVVKRGLPSFGYSHIQQAQTMDGVSSVICEVGLMCHQAENGVDIVEVAAHCHESSQAFHLLG
jgi:hypothetical protein